MFGQVVSATQPFTVTNNGTASETLTTHGCCHPQFVVSNNTCNDATLAPGGTCTFDLTFTAPTGCNPNSLYNIGPGFEFQGRTSNVLYITLTGTGSCPL